MQEGSAQTTTQVERPEGVHECVLRQEVAGVAAAGIREAVAGVAVADRKVALAFPLLRLELVLEDRHTVP